MGETAREYYDRIDATRRELVGKLVAVPGVALPYRIWSSRWEGDDRLILMLWPSDRPDPPPPRLRVPDQTAQLLAGEPLSSLAELLAEVSYDPDSLPVTLDVPADHCLMLDEAAGPPPGPE
jgi:hypothetical protein